MRKEILDRLEDLEYKSQAPEKEEIKVRFIDQAPGAAPGDWSRIIETGGFSIFVEQPPRSWKGMRRRR